MPTGTRNAIGNEIYDTVLYLTPTFPTLAANATGTSTLTVQGAQVGDIFSWNMQAPPAHLVLDNVYVSALNTITLLWSTDSVGISTATVNVLFEVVRPENANLGISNLPSNLL